MNSKRYITVTLLLALLALLVVSPLWGAGSTDSGSAPGEANAKAPIIFFPETSFQFDPVMDGTQVSHTFVVKNQGDGPLNINKVKTG
jgi:hypothetical protein